MMKSPKLIYQLSLIGSAFAISCLIAFPDFFFDSTGAETTRLKPIAQINRIPASESTLPTIVLSPLTDKARIEAALDRVNYSVPERVLVDSPNVNHWEKKLKLGIVARAHQTEIAGGENLGGLIVEEMKQDPDAAFSAIESLLSKLPPSQFPIDRASLIDVAGDLPGCRDRAKRLATIELRTTVIPLKPLPDPETLSEEELNQILTSDEIELIPMVAHSVVLRTSETPEEAMSLTQDAYRQQENPAIRETLIHQFVSMFPDLEQELLNELNTFNEPQSDAN